MDIHLEWYGPYLLSGLSEVGNEEYDYGVYQVYGTHPVYGSNVLLYIGKASQQTFGVRIQQEGWKGNQDEENIQIYVGRFSGKKKPSDKKWDQEITLAEQLLIHAHKPALNSQHIKSIRNPKLDDVHVLNWYSYRDLMPEVSGMRWKPKDEIDDHGYYNNDDDQE
ncbi:MAG: hypothetical protein L3J04_06525 [Robiginitomaculum sp.]|nr:hypothetical protein [Robiginitomaculum sp.]